MGVSFKVAKVGTRYRKPLIVDEEDEKEEEKEGSNDKSAMEADIIGARDNSSFFSNSVLQPGSYLPPQDLEVSFTLNLFPDGFSVGKASEFLQSIPKVLHPYDRASKSLFSAIEYGMLPGNILDDIPCKFVDGALYCEVRDYRKFVSKSSDGACSIERSPLVHKVRLQMCMENVIHDISSISDDSWTYSDRLKIESGILKALQPKLCLDPTPLLDRLCAPPVSVKLNLGIFEDRKRKQSNKEAANLGPNNISNRNNISCNEVLGNLDTNSYPIMREAELPCSTQDTSTSLPSKQQQNIVKEVFEHETPSTTQSKYDSAIRSSKSLRIAMTGPSNFIFMPEHDTDSYGVDTNSAASLREKRSIIESHSAPWPNIKRQKQEELVSVEVQRQHGQLKAFCGPNMQEESTCLRELQGANKISARFDDKKHSSMIVNDTPETILEGHQSSHAGRSHMDQSGVQNARQEPVKCGTSHNLGLRNITKPNNIIDSGSEHLRSLQSQLQPFTPGAKSHTLFSGQKGQNVEKDVTKESHTKKRRSGQITGPSQVPSCSELSNSKRIPSSTPVTTVSGLQKEEVMSVLVDSDKSASLNYSGNSREKKVSLPGKRKCASRLANTNSGNSLCTASSLMTATPSSSLPAVSEGDRMLERFLKIKTISERHQLNIKERNFDILVEGKKLSDVSRLPECQLSKPEDTNMKDANPAELMMSRCLLWRSLKSCITRIMTFMRQRWVFQGYALSTVVHESMKLVMSESPDDGTVEVYQFSGDEEENNPEGLFTHYVQLLPNTLSADLYASQYTSLMAKGDYDLIDDQVLPVPFHAIDAFCSQQPHSSINFPVGNGAPEPSSRTMFSNPPSAVLSHLNRSILVQNPQQLYSENILAGDYALPPDDVEASLQLPTDYLSKSIQVDRSVNFLPLNQHSRSHIQTPYLLTGNTNTLDNTSIQTVNILMLQQLLLQQQHHSNMQNTLAGGAGMALGTKNQGMIQSCGLNTENQDGLDAGRSVIGMSSTILEYTGEFPGLGNIVLNDDLIRSSNFRSPVSFTSQMAAELNSGNDWGKGKMAGVSIPGNSNDGMTENNFTRSSSYSDRSPISFTSQMAAEVSSRNGPGKEKMTGVSIPGHSNDRMTENNLMHGRSLLGQAPKRGGVARLQSPNSMTTGPPKFSSPNNINIQHHTRQQETFIQQFQSRKHQEEIERMKSMLSPVQAPLEMVVPKNLGSPSAQVSLQRNSHPTQMKSPHTYERTLMPPQQQSTQTVPPRKQLNSGITATSPMNPQVSSQAHGSLGIGSPMEPQSGSRAD